MRNFDEDTGWESARSDTLFTVAALEASGEHPDHLAAMRDAFALWSTAETARRDAEDTAVRANAAVSLRTVQLDQAVRIFANAARFRAGGTQDEDTYRAYFPDALRPIVRARLASKIEKLARVVITHQEVALTPHAEQAFQDVVAAIARGNNALAARENAERVQALASLGIARWKRDTTAVRRRVYVALQAWALEHDRDPAYADAFFPEPPTRKKKKSEET